MTSKPKLSDVYRLTVGMRPVTRCEPPEGTRCFLETGSTVPTATDARKHAFAYPGHYVVRDEVKRTSYVLDEHKAAGK